MHLNVLKGVSCPDHRATLIELNSEGWEIERTNGGHLRLKHKDAEKPVFSSVTTSDYRSRKNLVAECRNAIRLSRGNRTSGEAPPLSEADIQNALRKSKTIKRSQKRRVVFDKYNPASVSPDAAEAVERLQKPVSARNAMTSIPSAALDATGAKPLTKKQAISQAEALFAKKEVEVKGADKGETPVVAGACPADLTPETGSQPSAPEIPALAAQTPAEQTIKATKASKPKKRKTALKKEKTMEVKAIDTKAATPVNVNAAEAEAGISNVIHISDEVMELARKIVSGKYRQIDVTADMVGKTLLVDGEVLIASGAAPTASVSPAQSTAMAEATVDAVVKVGTNSVNDKVLATLREFAPESVTQKDIAELLWQDLGYKSVNSAYASISSRMTRLVRKGAVIESKKEGKRAFNLA
jgi:hypothetical protein